jgi:ABC-type transport system involved in cytochrome c biogenesis permease subunit
MLSGVGIICFAGSYAIVLALEISRLWFRSGIRGAAMIGWALAGLFVHTVFLYHRAVNTTGVPLSSWQDWMLVAAWALMAVYLYLLFFHSRTSMGLFILPLVLGLIVVAAFAADNAPFQREPASKIWGMIHGSSLAAATVSMLVGMAAGIMYLGQMRRLKHKRLAGQGLRLPSLEWLERINHRAIIIALIMLGIGVIGGMILNSIKHQPGQERLPWSDPFILSTLIMFFWLLAVVAIGLIYRPARKGRGLVLLTFISIVLLVVALAVGLMHDTRHGGVRSDDGRNSFNQKNEIDEWRAARVEGEVF